MLIFVIITWTCNGGGGFLKFSNNAETVSNELLYSVTLKSIGLPKTYLLMHNFLMSCPRHLEKYTFTKLYKSSKRNISH